MARFTVNGLEIDYELIGDENGQPLVITPGGRHPRDAAGVPELGEMITGGPVSLAQLGFYYYWDQVDAAAKGGMEAVAALPSWADQICRNPRIREILLEQDRDQFIETLQGWCQALGYSADSPLPGIDVREFQRLTMPVLVFRSGKSDMAILAARASFSTKSCPIPSFRIHRGQTRSGTTCRRFRPMFPIAAGALSDGP